MADKVPSSTPQTSSVLEDLRALQDRVVERIRELEPYADELGQLKEQADKLGIDLTSAPAKASSRRAPAKRSAGAQRKSSPARRRGRRSSGGQSRSEQVLALVREQPGISIPSLGQALGVDSTGLYRVARNLEADGLITKQGRELQPVSATDRTAEPAAS